MSPTNPEKGKKMWPWYALLTSVLGATMGIWIDLPSPWDLVAWGVIVVLALIFIIEVFRGNVFALALLFPLALAAQAPPLMAQELTRASSETQVRSAIGVGLIAFGKPVRPERLNCVRWGWSGGFDLALRFSYEADEGSWGPYARLTLVPVTSLHVWDATAGGCPGWFSGRPQGRARDKFGVMVPTLGVQWEPYSSGGLTVLLRAGAGFLSVYGGDEAWWGGGPMMHLQGDLEAAVRLPLRGGLQLEIACGGYPGRLWGLEVLHAAAQGDVGREHGNWTAQLACFGSVVR